MYIKLRNIQLPSFHHSSLAHAPPPVLYQTPIKSGKGKRVNLFTATAAAASNPTLNPVVCNDSVRSKPLIACRWAQTILPGSHGEQQNNPGLQNNCNHFIVSEQTTNFPSSLSRLQFTSSYSAPLSNPCLLFLQSIPNLLSVCPSPSPTFQSPWGCCSCVMRWSVWSGVRNYRKSVAALRWMDPHAKKNSVSELISNSIAVSRILPIRLQHTQWMAC